jgi:hypothetical protein
MLQAADFEPAGGWGETAEQVVERWTALDTPLAVPGAVLWGGNDLAMVASAVAELAAGSR